MIDKEQNILFTSVGRRSYLVEYFKKELNGRGKIHAANSSELSPAFLEADHYVVTPLIYEESYIPFLLKYCEDNRISILISLFDVDLMVLAKNKKKFEDIGVRIIVSDEDVISKCNDKWNTYNFLKDNGFNTPRTYICIESALKDIEKNVITYPLIIKPRWGMGSIAVFEADNEEELTVFYVKVRRDIFNSYLKYESEENIQECVLIQEKIKGQEYGLDIINNLDSEYQNTIVKKKIAMRSGETDCAVTEKNEHLEKVGKSISKKLGHIANLDVDVFVSNQKIYVLEMNARFGGGYPFSHMSGVNLPLAILEWSNSEKSSKKLFKYRNNIMIQKDICLVELRGDKKMVDREKFKKYVKEVEGDFPIPLSERVDLEEYADKLYYDSTLICEEENSEIIGFVAGYINETESMQAYVSILSVHKNARGKGLARKLMTQFVEECRKKNFRKVSLHSNVSNTIAYELWLKLGFVVDAQDGDRVHMTYDLKG